MFFSQDGLNSGGNNTLAPNEITPSLLIGYRCNRLGFYDFRVGGIHTIDIGPDF
jgi:hypothetical protein